jgi:hypothetical protein
VHIQKAKTLKTKTLLLVAALAFSGLVGLSLPAQAETTKSLIVSGFAPNSAKLTKAMKVKIKKFVRQNPSYAYVSCVGFADRPGRASANNSLGKKRAVVGCERAVKNNLTLITHNSSGRWEKSRSGSSFRKVKITLSVGHTTTFDAMGGALLDTQTMVRAGSSIILPTPTRAGFEFLGWYSEQYLTKVGNGGDKWAPSGNSTLWAQWRGGPSVSVESPNAGGDSETTNPFSSLTWDIQLARGVGEPRCIELAVLYFIVEGDVASQTTTNDPGDTPEGAVDIGFVSGWTNVGETFTVFDGFEASDENETACHKTVQITDASGTSSAIDEYSVFRLGEGGSATPFTLEASKEYFICAVPGASDGGGLTEWTIALDSGSDLVYADNVGLYCIDLPPSGTVKLIGTYSAPAV